VPKAPTFLYSFLRKSSPQCVWDYQFFVTSKLIIFFGIAARHAFPEKISYIANYPDAVLSPGFPSTPGDEPESLSAAEQRLFHLQRQLDIETKAGHPLLTMHRLFFIFFHFCELFSNEEISIPGKNSYLRSSLKPVNFC
jgi:hypothetical protein